MTILVRTATDPKPAAGHTHRVRVADYGPVKTRAGPCADPENCPMTDGKMEQFRADRDAAIADTVILRAEVERLKDALDRETLLRAEDTSALRDRVDALAEGLIAETRYADGLRKDNDRLGVRISQLLRAEAALARKESPP